MSSCKSRSFISNDEVTELCEFYGSVITENFMLSEDIVSDVKAVLHSEKDLSEIQGNPHSYLLACILKFGVHDACLSILKFYESAMECQKIIQKLCGKRRIKVCCLGSESLLAAVGICKVIDELVRHYTFSEDPFEVQLFLIDKKRGWKQKCQNLVSAANTCCKEIKLKLNYVVADLTENWMNDALLGVSNSHIVVMSRFLSRSSFATLEKFLEKTLDKMKKSAFLFYLDGIGQGHHDTLKDVISKKDSFSKLRSCKIKYTSLESLQSERYGSQLPFSWTHKSTPVRCSVWVNYPGVKVEPSNNTDELIFPQVLSQSDIKNMTLQPDKRVPSVTPKPKIGLRSTKSAIRNKNDRHRQKAKRIAASRNAIEWDDED